MTPEVEAALVALGALADPTEKAALDAVFADLPKAAARFVKKLKALTDSWPTPRAALGRAALEQGASLLAGRDPDKAARLFSLARRLERSAKLPADWPTLLALATSLARRGALDRRDLSRLLKELGSQADAGLELVQAHLDGGGAPPDTLIRDVEGLLKKARIPQKERAARLATLLDALLQAPALPQASAKFWAAHRAHVAAHVRGQPELQDALLRATPQIHPLGYDGTFDPAFAETWRTLLDEAGCIEALAAGTLATPAADFIELACTRVGVYLASAIVVGWLESLAAPLAAGRSLRLYVDDKGAQSFDPDVLDAALELGLPLEGPEGLGHPWMHLGQQTRALTHLADHPGFGPLFEAMFTRSVEDHFHGDAFAAASLTVEGFRPLWLRRLARYAAALTEGTVLSLEHATRDLGAIIGPELFRAFPELAEVVERIDLAALLTRTLNEGLVDEWGWPALDEAHRRVPAKPYDQDGFTPFLTVYEPTRFVVCGPDGIVYDGPLELPEGVQTPRRVIWIGGQPLVVYRHGSLLLARWGAEASGETWKTDYLQMGHTGWVLPDGRVTAGGKPIGPGDRTWDGEGGLLTDGTGWWRLRGQQLEAFDPDTGEATDAPLHPWLAEVDPATVGALRLLPAWGDHPTPIGAPGAPSGLRVSGTVAERLDGRRCEGIDGVLALMTFPGGSGLHAVHRDNDHNSTLIRTADGAHPLANAMFPGAYSRGSAQLLAPEWWGLYRPRDEAGSRALRRATRDQAAALLQAAAAREPEVADAVRRVLPEVSHPNLIAGIAGVATHAAGLEAVVAEWRASLGDLVDAEPVAPEDDIADAEAPILRSLFPRGDAFFGTFHLGRQLRETERFFFEPGLGDGDSRPVSRSAIAWEALLDNAAPIAWRAASPVAVAEEDRGTLQRVLSLWARSRFAEEGVRERMRRSFGRAVDYPVTGMDWRSCQRLAATEGHRYLVRVTDASSARDRGFGVLELRSEDTGFVDLPGVPAQWARTAGWGSAGQLQALLATLDREGPFPADPAIGDQISAGTGLPPASGLLLWTGGLRGKALGLTHDDLKLAGLELDVDLDALYRAAMPPDPTSLWRPLEEDATGTSPVARLVDAWNGQVGARPVVDRDLLLRLFDDFGDDHRHDVRLRQILQADQIPVFIRDTSWAVRPYRGFQNNISYMQGFVPPGWPQPASAEAFSGPTLRTTVRYLPWLYQELPLGSPLHHAVVRWAERIDERLKNPALLMLAGAVDLSLQEEPAELAEAFAALRDRFEGEPYTSPDGDPVAPGIDRGDLVVTWPEDLPNGIFVAFRPAALADPAALQRLARDLGFGEAFERQGGMCTCGLRFGQWEAMDITELDEFVAWRSPGFARIRARLDRTRDAFDPSVPRYDADPRVSAPQAVAAVRAALDLSEDSATLYLQTATLARPSRDHVRRYNGWSLQEYRGAAAPLAERGLVVERKVAATGREWFLDEPMVEFTTRSSPLESSKLALYGIEGLPVFGMVLPCRPLGELFGEVADRIRS